MGQEVDHSQLELDQLGNTLYSVGLSLICWYKFGIIGTASYGAYIIIMRE